VRFIEYIWTSISLGTPWVFGNSSVQLIAWVIGMIGPVFLASGLLFGFNRTIFVFSVLAILISATAITWWLLELDYWMNASPPSSCDGDACDNDAEIRSLFMAGALLLPAFIPSLFVGALTLLVSSRRIFNIFNPTQTKIG
jgi:hypothetical protein